MQRKRGTSLLLIFLGLALLAGAAARLGAIKQLRREYDFDPADAVTDQQTASQLQIPTLALFTFRSLAIDYLWIRADTLKNEGQYFDAMHLARLICALQPNLPTVWDFQGWNMAYNISVAMPNPPERWHWIEAGFKLLRDEGLKALPRSPDLYLSLGQIFSDKIGSNVDDFHRDYKKRLAYAMMELLGAGLVTNEELSAMAQMPRKWRQLKDDPNIVELAERIIAVEPKFNDDQQMMEGLLRLPSFPTEYDPKVHQLLEDNRNNYALRRLQRFIRTSRLREVWKMEPELMLEINAKYGPADPEQEGRRLSLDWRLPYCHAIYWAARGLEYTTDTGLTWVGLRRLLYQNLQNMFYFGNLQILNPVRPQEATFGAAGQEIFSQQARMEVELYNGQDMRMFPAAFQAMMDTIEERYKDNPDKELMGPDDAAAYLTWSLIVDTYLGGHEKLSRSAYSDLQRLFPENEDYKISLEEFVAERLKDELSGLTPKVAGQYIESMLSQSFLRWAIRDDDTSAAYENKARRIHQQQEDRLREINAEVDRQMLPTYPDMKVLSLKGAFLNPLVENAVKRLLWGRLEQEQPQLLERLKAELEKEQLKIIL
ncbi:MAG: hypothetical protein AMJ79_04605 [Phycisphaerae bacterium SM23_30]|nr:MAG: hypothetical protein AMJ79_04605 [Phycisphaerae bacterium SM23_30]